MPRILRGINQAAGRSDCKAGQSVRRNGIFRGLSQKLPADELKYLGIHSTGIYVAKAYQMLGDRNRSLAVLSEELQRLRNTGNYEEMWAGYLLAAEIHYQNSFIIFNCIGQSCSALPTVSFLLMPRRRTVCGRSLKTLTRRELTCKTRGKGRLAPPFDAGIRDPCIGGNCSKEQIYNAIWFDSDSNNIKNLISVNLRHLKNDLECAGIEKSVICKGGTMRFIKKRQRIVYHYNCLGFRLFLC